MYIRAVTYLRPKHVIEGDADPWTFRVGARDGT